MTVVAVVACTAGLSSGVARAQATKSSGDFRTFDVTPAAAPTPFLKYRLTVDPVDRLEGNAAPLYLQATLTRPTNAELDPVIEAYDRIADDGEFAAAMEADAKWLDAGVPPLLESATLRERCDWEVPIRHEHFRTLLPQLHHMKPMAMWLLAKSRLALARGDVDQAIHLLRVCSTMADDIDAERTFVVNNLVSIAVQGKCMDAIERLVCRADAPNLYWALRQYSVPFGNVRSSAEAEQTVLVYAIPLLAKARQGELRPDEWRTVLRELIAYAPLAAGQPQLSAEEAEGELAGAIGLLARPSPEAIDHYARTRRLSAGQAERVDPLTVAMAHYFESYEAASHDYYKWFSLPYDQALPGLVTAEANLAALRAGQPSNPFLSMIPTFSRILQSNARLDRTIAAFAVVEAIRGYAAKHDGKPPASLDALTEMPAPLNPVTGKAFTYEVEGNVAIISDEGALIGQALRYEVRLRE